MKYALWIVQVLLALVFVFAGGVKLVLPIDVLQEQMQLALPDVFIRFIGVAEVLGALGLILPGLLRIRPDLTRLAAAGLAVVMLGALMFVPPGSELPVLLMPAVLGLLAGFVAYGRWRPSRYRPISVLVDESCSSGASTAADSSGTMRWASTLPSSTPH